MISLTTDMIPSDVTLSAWEKNRGVSCHHATKILRNPIKNKTERSLKITIRSFIFWIAPTFYPSYI